MDNIPVNVFDIAVALILLGSAVLAYARGFAHEALSILVWVGAVAATVYGYSYALPYTRRFLGADIKGDVATGAVIFVATLAILSLTNRHISKRIRESGLGAVDRSLGFLFGIARGALIVCVLYMAVDWLSPRFPEPGSQERAALAKQAREAKREGRPLDDPRFGWPAWVEKSRTIRFVAAGATELWTLVPDGTLGEAKSEAEEARERAKRLLDTERSLRNLISPTPKVKEYLQKDGYGAKERRELDRLLNQSTGSIPSRETTEKATFPANAPGHDHWGPMKPRW